MATAVPGSFLKQRKRLYGCQWQKDHMKRIVLVLLATMLLNACTKEKEYDYEGTLVKPDVGSCTCCGGIILTIDNISSASSFRIDTLPFISWQQLLSLTYPRRIKFNYTESSDCGSTVRPKITEFYMK
jgi:hypothetical protein